MADTRGAGNLWNNNRVVPYQFEPPAQEHERNVEENNHIALGTQTGVNVATVW
ncbi:hypothetical protein V1264_006050 [Littorina saxatilis]|uniref:Uncharacterized protein n=1 Tax=Littorina saxatilis TaxID=31220 RepID=A0AAN9AW96_9CAEN